MASTAMVSFDLSKLRVAARTLAAAVPAPMGFLKMDKSGDWCQGAEGDPIPDGTQFAVNPESFQRGYVAWADTSNGAPANKLDERMYSVFAELPDSGTPPAGSRGWEAQFGFGLKAINGKFAGTELLYRASSDGGKRAISALTTEIAEGAELNPGKIPLIVLDNRWYKHASYGKIFVPVFKIVKWVPMPVEKTAKVTPAKKAAER